MRIELLITAPKWHSHKLQDWADSAYDALNGALALPDKATISLLACDDARMATLNDNFRKRASATNVLSWPAYNLAPNADGHPPAIEFDDPLLGDIAIAYETCTREAAKQGKAFDAHVTHLCLHAMLHLLGYDHQTPQQTRVMESLEISLLAKLGIANPYCYAGA